VVTLGGQKWWGNLLGPHPVTVHCQQILDSTVTSSFVVWECILPLRATLHYTISVCWSVGEALKQNEPCKSLWLLLLEGSPRDVVTSVESQFMTVHLITGDALTYLKFISMVRCGPT